MILEGIVTTLDSLGELNVAPMGPEVDSDFGRFVLKPFRNSRTYRNLVAVPEGVLHVTDDVLLFARAALGMVVAAPTSSAEHVRGRVLLECCRYYEFRVTEFDDREERSRLHSETVHRGVFRDFFGFNRARHAVLEVAILATRIHLMERHLIVAELAKHRPVVEKTGGERELDALDLLEAHIRSCDRQSRDQEDRTSP